MFFANLNVFVGIVACAGYGIAWLLGIPVSTLITLSGAYSAALIGYFFIAIALLYVWHKWGLAPPLKRSKGKFYHVGLFALTVANIALLGGVALSLLARTHSNEEEYWAGFATTFILGPVAVFLAVLGLAAIYITASRRTQGARKT